MATKSILVFLILAAAVTYALYVFADNLSALAFYIGWFIIIIFVAIIAIVVWALLGAYVFDRCPKGGAHNFEGIIGGTGGFGCEKCHERFGAMSKEEAFKRWHRRSHS
ncbi:MAG: hypothetical protein WCV59_02040 [Parcubacteria group bacterium]